ncbi:calcium-binding protein [Oleiphilus messinensis]|uniref:calcium-binding protein n=1 Tax=Oleiphilus messinensis TaxID=141451 RepID=UPI000B3B789C|nr:calcium-binding protein [Oleiphilus messinensis]
MGAVTNHPQRTNKSSPCQQITGGPGDGTLIEFASADTYYFERGDGIDTIRDNDNYRGQTDKIVFGEGITPEQLVFSKVGAHIQIDLLDAQGELSGDRITILHAVIYTVYRIEFIEFADGSSLNSAEILALAQ